MARGGPHLHILYFSLSKIVLVKKQDIYRRVLYKNSYLFNCFLFPNYIQVQISPSVAVLYRDSTAVSLIAYL